MFRPMRRHKQLLSMEGTKAVLDRCTSGVLSCIGDNDYPYGIPLSYIYYNDRIYFHCGKEGHKIDAIRKNPKVSFTVIDADKIVSAEYTSYFRSVIAFGKARVTEGDEWLKAFTVLCDKYSGDRSKEEIDKKILGCTRSHVIAIDIEHITGKEAIELVNTREN